MDIVRSVVEFGTKAVLRYRTISDRPDNELPEVFLGGYVASRLYDQFQCPIHVEYDYLYIADRCCKAAITSGVFSQVGHYRADIAMCPKGQEPTVIEFKIFDEGTQVPSILNDVDKIRKLSRICPVNGYVGVVICQTEGPLQGRIEQLKRALDQKLYVGEVQWSADKKWEWCFGCAPCQ